MPRFEDNRDEPEARFPRRRRKRSSNAASDGPTPNENLLYLMSELERALKHPGMKWSTDLAIDLQRRLVQLITQIVARTP